VPGDLVYDEQLRAAAFDHLTRLLDGSPDSPLASADINRFEFHGRAVPLVVQTGIWKPATLEAALSIRTTYTPPSQLPPYADDIGDDGLLRYKWRGTDSEHSDNRALRVAMQRGAPLVYFVGVDRGVYVPRYPVWLVGEDQQRREFTVAVDVGQRLVDLDALAAPQREYVRRLTNLRLHQPIFRARVLRAYGESCAMCRLRHADLLDAAHILPDTHPRGEPVVPNGLALCKIHHAAYDRNILGVRPDLQVDVQPRVLAEIDGPMLRHGLQEMAGVRLLVPRRVDAQPDPDRLGERYREFRAVG
jgi:putative restriction endonuclease